MYKGKTLLGVVNKLFVFSNVFPLRLKQTFLPIIWIFIEGEGDGIKSRLPFKSFSRKKSLFIFEQLKIQDLWIQNWGFDLISTLKNTQYIHPEMFQIWRWWKKLWFYDTIHIWCCFPNTECRLLITYLHYRKE